MLPGIEVVFCKVTRPKVVINVVVEYMTGHVIGIKLVINYQVVKATSAIRTGANHHDEDQPTNQKSFRVGVDLFLGWRFKNIAYPLVLMSRNRQFFPGDAANMRPTSTGSPTIELPMSIVSALDWPLVPTVCCRRQGYEQWPNERVKVIKSPPCLRLFYIHTR